jgi:hypothetical protein
VAVGWFAAGCSKAPASMQGGAAGSSWVANGATACDAYLTQSVTADILTHPAGQSKKLSPQSCTYDTTDDGGSISVTLANAGPATFDSYQQYLANPVPLAGVGDKASQSMIGIVAVKGNDRMCTIDAGGAPGSLRLKGEELGRKLGAICNQLFALP